MIKLNPVLKDYLWGGMKFGKMYGRDNGGKKMSESWEVSVHPDGLSTCEGGTLADYLAKDPQAVDKAGSPFPVLIKYIDAAQNLSVQVHPDDEYARRVENDNGKTEMWYILGADGKLRPLHVEKAVGVINFKAFEDHTNTGTFAAVAGGRMRRLTGCKYFGCRLLDLDGTYSEENKISFTALNVLKGEGKADGKPFKAGDSFFVPCGEKFTLEGKAEIVLTTEGKA